jgi:hypothetical protein
MALFLPSPRTILPLPYLLSVIRCKLFWLTLMYIHKIVIIRGPFAKFVDSPYYSDSEFCGGTLTVSFSKYLPWKAMHSLQRSTHFSKMCCTADRWSLRNFLLRSSLFMVGKAQKSHGTRFGLYGGCSNGVPPTHFFPAEHRIQIRSRPMRFLGFSNHETWAQR